MINFPVEENLEAFHLIKTKMEEVTKQISNFHND